MSGQDDKKKQKNKHTKNLRSRCVVLQDDNDSDPEWHPNQSDLDESTSSENDTNLVNILLIQPPASPFQDSDPEESNNSQDSQNDDRDSDPNKKTRSKKRRRSSSETSIFASEIKRIHNSWNRDEFGYYRQQSRKDQKAINSLEHQIYKHNIQDIPLRFRIILSEMETKLKANAISKLLNMRHDDYKMYNYLESLTRLPIGKYQEISVTVNDDLDKITGFLEKTQEVLDQNLYGHKTAKNQIIKLLAKWMSNPSSGGLVIGLEGPMGCGKTMFSLSLSKALQLPFCFIPLGGVNDGCYLTGHSYTYEGSQPGKIAESLARAGCMNPVFYFDELDKVSGTRYGEEVINTLIHLTDSTQNSRFQDRYFSNVDLDLSKSLIVFSYNKDENINPILKDRMIKIKADPYTKNDKVHIAQHYMIPEILREYKFQSTDLKFDPEIIGYIIDRSPNEEGVRNMKRSLQEIVSQLNLLKILKKPINIKKKEISLEFPLRITSDIVDSLLPRQEVSHLSYFI